MTDRVSLGRVLRQRRRQMEITQEQVAQRAGVRANYIGYLERDMRRPSTPLLAKLAKALDLDQSELFFLAHPQVREIVHSNGSAPKRSAWEQFRTDKALHTRYSVSRAELKALESVSRLGAARSPRDFLFVLQAIRQAVS